MGPRGACLALLVRAVPHAIGRGHPDPLRSHRDVCVRLPVLDSRPSGLVDASSNKTRLIPPPRARSRRRRTSLSLRPSHGPRAAEPGPSPTRARMPARANVPGACMGRPPDTSSHSCVMPVRTKERQLTQLSARPRPSWLTGIRSHALAARSGQPLTCAPAAWYGTPASSPAARSPVRRNRLVHAIGRACTSPGFAGPALTTRQYPGKEGVGVPVAHDKRPPRKVTARPTCSVESPASMSDVRSPASSSVSTTTPSPFESASTLVRTARHGKAGSAGLLGKRPQAP